MGRTNSAAIVVALPIALLTGCGSGDRHHTGVADPFADAIKVLSEPASSPGFKQATGPRDFTFPQDHGPHPEYRTEWWYFTGNLATTDQREFGYELTIFRHALTREPARSVSNWRTGTAYMAHLAITDVSSGRFYSFERIARGAAGLAGATLRPFRVFVDSWSISSSGDASLPWTLRARDRRVSLALELQSGKPPVLQGNEGLSQKSEELGNASYYYSMTRVPTVGVLEVDGSRFKVSGNSWVDREWSTSALAPHQAGWDWFALQLDDGRDLMFYRLRQKDGRADPHSAGALVDPAGVKSKLELHDVEMRPRRHWINEVGVAYPVAWSLAVPSHSLDLFIEPVLDDQELDVAFRYWEGAVRVSGTSQHRPVTGKGYLELAGYSRATESGEPR